jgi:DNA polymerase-3 subunit epsilon
VKLADLSHRLTSDLTFVALDTETTGLGEAYLVEVAAVKFKAGAILGEFSTLINPGRHIPSYVTAIHGITDEMVKNAPYAREALPDFFDFLEDAILIAHNASFDIKVLAAELFRSDLAIPGREALDTCRIARRAMLSSPNYRLITLAQYLGLSRLPDHRALADAQAVVAVFEYCLQTLPWPQTLEEVLKVNGRPYSFARAVASSQIIRHNYWPECGSSLYP